MTGRMPEEGINPVEFPEIMQDVWEWFGDLCKTRTASMGPEAAFYREMESYFRLMRVVPDPWQVKAITRLDRAWFEAKVKKDK